MSDYAAFLASKAPADAPSGLTIVPPLCPALKPFQAAITAWALRRGRAAIFAGTGLGKTLMQLEWANNVTEHTGLPVLILCPLAVAEQTVAEADKWGIPGVAYAADQSQAVTPMVVTNYERFEKFDISRFVGIVLDESGIIKSHDGATRKLLTEACRDVPWRLCCTATPSPNDYTELGQHSEFLGVMDAKEMLAMFFVHDGSIRANDATQGNDGWRMKRHAAADFWRWLASWSVMVRHPRDLGFDEPGYDLPPLNLHQVTVAAEYKPTAGELFPMLASTLSQRIGVRRDTAADRISHAVNIICNPDHFRSKLPPCYQTKQRNDERPPLASDTPRTQPANRRSKTPLSKVDEPTRVKPTCEPITPLTRSIGTREPKSKEILTTQNAGKNTPLIQNSERNSSSGQNLFPAAPLKKNENGVSKTVSDYQLKNMISCSPNRGGDAESVGENIAIPQVEGWPSITATEPGTSEVFSAVGAIADSDNSPIAKNSSEKRSNTLIVHDPESWVVWCNLNSEQDALEKKLGDKCLSVFGSLPSHEKVRRIGRWMNGDRPILLSKPSICGHGLNLQRCHRMLFVGLTDSFEQVYQAIRRCWRFGQTRPVEVYFVASELEGNVVANLKRKEAAFELMLDSMSIHMTDLMRENVIGGRNATVIQSANKRMELPAWIN